MKHRGPRRFRVASLVAGQVTVDQRALAVARFKVDGSLDMTFGSGGLSVPDIDLGESGASAVVIAPDGKIIVTGVVAGVSGGTFGNAQQKFVIARFDTDGALDSSFGTSGITVTGFAAGLSNGGSSLVRLSNGTLVVCGALYSPEGHGVLIGYDDAGQLDPSFGDAGAVKECGATNCYEPSIYSSSCRGGW